MKNSTIKFLAVAVALLISVSTFAQRTIDLTGIDNPDVLLDSLPAAPAGSVVLLVPGMTYNIGNDLNGGYAFDKSLTLMSKDPSNLNLPKINCRYNFNVVSGATIDSIIFKSIEFFGTFNDRYVINTTVGATIGEFRFESCEIRNLRGIYRMKDNGPGTLGTYAIIDSKIDSIRDYGILTVDVNTWACDNIVIKNSTISKVRAFITNKNNSTSVLIENCNINEVPSTGQRLFRWREAGQDNVTNGITIKNTLWGHGWDESNSGSTAYDGFDGLSATNWNIENTFAAKELEFAADKDTIKQLLDNVYEGTIAELWTAPGMSEFNFVDTTFAGIANTGDPRWAVATDDGGLEWNMGARSFKYLGDIDMTAKINGLTVFANSAKKVAVDGNIKTVDELSFSHRIKLGGSGGFAEDGQPDNRVLAIDVHGNTKITVMAMSSSSGSDRILNIKAGTAELPFAELPALGASLTKGEYTYMGEPTKIFFYSPSSGVNVYYIKTTPVATSTNQLVKPEVGIYPNPASGKVYINFERPVQVGIYNIAGSLIISKLVQSQNDFINIEGLQSGIYLIRSQNDNSFARKLIVK